MNEIKDTSLYASYIKSDADFKQLMALLKALPEDPIEGLAGYLVTEDPTYLPEMSEAKILIRQIGRDRLLRLFLAHALYSFHGMMERE